MGVALYGERWNSVYWIEAEKMHRPLMMGLITFPASSR